MSQATVTPAEVETLADLLQRLGDISPNRVLLHPPPGTATEADLLHVLDKTDRLCELVEGTLVEKPMGYHESMLAAVLIQLLRNYLDQTKLGVIAAPDGPLKLLPNLVRLPEISFVRWERLPDLETLKRQPIPPLAPDLAVEVISRSNTKKEMARKLQEYFKSGTRLVWFVDPPTRTVTVYTSTDDSRLLDENQTLDGGDVLPAFGLPVRELFDRAFQQPEP